MASAYIAPNNPLPTQSAAIIARRRFFIFL
jgi:hypothetical protein